MSEHNVSSPEITFGHAPAESTKRIWVVLGILSVLTVVELCMGFGIARHWYGNPAESKTQTIVLFIKGVICILSFAKAYYIVSVFMHLGGEIRNFIMTIVVPLCLFIWFIIAFLWDGDSWKKLRNKYHGQPAKTEQAAPAHQQGAKD